THAHGDHVASLDALYKQLPNADSIEIAFGGRTAAFLAGDKSLKPDEPQAKLRGDFEPCRTAPTRLLNEGDMVGSLRVVASPGHTPDHIAFYDERDGSLIAGDAFQTQGGVAVAGQLRWTFPFPAMATWHKTTAVETAQRLLALNPSRLAVGHGQVIENPQAAMRQAIQQAAAKTNISVEAR
ncbi:MAG: MBL fold metallo-hydrolase, partial [Anaerolineales bacterium]|nr:MBL fold metallo-hydrolase [Anaerolineales bacterium]